MSNVRPALAHVTRRRLYRLRCNDDDLWRHWMPLDATHHHAVGRCFPEQGPDAGAVVYGNFDIILDIIFRALLKLHTTQDTTVCCTLLRAYTNRMQP